MALTEQEKTDIRFYLGYGMRGDDPKSASDIYSHDFNPSLEDNMLHLTESEEKRVRALLDEIREIDEELTLARSLLNIKVAGEFARNQSHIRDLIQVQNRYKKQLAAWFKTEVKGLGGGWIV